MPRPYQVIVVDASAAPATTLSMEFPKLDITFHRYEGSPSAAAQRNYGLKLVAPNAQFVGFLDDDITFAPNALNQMAMFWKLAPMKVVGVSFNLLNPLPTTVKFLKKSRLMEQVGLYSVRMGRVMSSGWQTVIHSLSKNLDVEWLPSTASIWRRMILKPDFFDPFFKGYSYLEDLDASYGLYKKGYRLMVVADAGFYHWPSPSGRSSAVQFGRVETRNRLYFIRKHQLSLLRCIVALIIRALMTLAEGDFGRLGGNLLGIYDFLNSNYKYQ